MTDELLLTEDMQAKVILARMCRANIIQQRRNRQAGQINRRKNP